MRFGAPDKNVRHMPIFPERQRRDTPFAKVGISARVSLSPGELQNLAGGASTLTKSLAGCDVQFEVAVSIKPKAGTDLTGASKVLEKIKAGWNLS